jgi:DNA-binding transcriptional LysR family regulator
MRRVVVGAPSYFAGHGEPRTPHDLVHLDCVTFDAIGAAEGWSFADAGGGEIDVPVRPRLSVNTAEAAIDAAVAGTGLTRVLTYQAAGPVAAGALKVVLADYEKPPLPISLMHPGQGRLPLKTRAFLDLAAPRLRRVLASLA